MGPLFKIALRSHLQDALQKTGYTRQQVRRAMSRLDDEMIETAFAMSGVSVASLPPAAMEERPILDAIANFLKIIGDWFKSPEGQEFLKMLFQLLIGLIGGLAVVAGVVAMGHVELAGRLLAAFLASVG